MLSFSKIVLLAAVIGGVIAISRFLKRREEARDRVESSKNEAKAAATGPASQDKDIVHLDACPYCGAYADLRLHHCDRNPGAGPV